MPIEFEHNGQSKIVTIAVILLPSSNRRRKQSVSLMRFDQFYLDLWIALFAFAIGTLERKIYLLLLCFISLLLLHIYSHKFYSSFIAFCYPKTFKIIFIFIYLLNVYLPDVCFWFIKYYGHKLMLFITYSLFFVYHFVSFSLLLRY